LAHNQKKTVCKFLFWTVTNSNTPTLQPIPRRLQKKWLLLTKNAAILKITSEGSKCGMAGGHLLLQSFWANKAIFQLMILPYNLLMLFKTDFANGTKYRQQIKTFRLKYILLAGKIIRTARSVIMKLSEKYPYREMYEQSFVQEGSITRLTRLFVF
jgi:hypothetical protein